MSASDIFLLLVRWLHLISAAAWIGGSLFYVAVLRPALRRDPEPSKAINKISGPEFRALVDTCILVLLTTGIILTVNRLTPGEIGFSYVGTLSLKIILSIWMFILARGRRRRVFIPESFESPSASNVTNIRRFAHVMSGYNMIIILGLAVFLLADLLKVLFEMSLSR